MTWQHLKAVILLPFMVTVVIPTIILHFTGLDGMAPQRPTPWNVLIVAGAALLFVVGLVLFVTTVSLFAQIGRGTLAPSEPTATPDRGRPLPPRSQSNDLGCAVSPLGRGSVLWVAADLGLVRFRTRPELDLHPVGRGAGPGKAIWRRIPPVQATRSPLDSSADAVARYWSAARLTVTRKQRLSRRYGSRL